MSADKSLVISSFKYGLDTRRENLVSLPGTLQQCQNAFINSGGEIEKRRAFVLIGTIPATSFGLQDTDTGIMVFSTLANPGGLPTNIVWKQISYPSNPAPGGISSVFFTTSFKGKSFALIGFDNEDATFGYYDGVLVNQITDGIVLTHPGGGGVPETISDLSSDLAAIVSRISGWLAHANVKAGVPSVTPSIGYDESALAGSTLIMTPIGIHMTPVVENNNSIAGLLGVRLLDQNFVGIGAISASAFFTLNAGTNGTVDVQAPSKSDGSGVISITNIPIAFNTNLTQTGADIAAAINNFTYVSGYTAKQAGGTVTVYAPTSFGNVTFNLTVITTGDITTNQSGTAGVLFTLTLNPSNLNASIFIPGAGGVGNVGGTMTALITGAGGPVTVTWTMLNPWSGSPMVGDIIYSCDGKTYGPLQSPITGPSCHFLAALSAGTSTLASFKVHASDGVNSADVTCFVKISYNH